jgi:drug/metabolite transporter (DMT)-like permease
MLLVLGVLEPGLTYVLLDLAVRRTTASHAALLLALDGPATLALAVRFLRERISLPLLTSLVMGLAGSVLVTGTRIRRPGTHGQSRRPSTELAIPSAVVV